MYVAYYKDSFIRKNAFYPIFLYRGIFKAFQSFFQAFHSFSQLFSESLCKAQLLVKRLYPHPSYWAGFNLTGDYR